jgi:hypothetical protein
MKPDICQTIPPQPNPHKETVHNAAVMKHDDEYIIMLFRSHLCTGRSIIRLARSPRWFPLHRRPKSSFWPEQSARHGARRVPPVLQGSFEIFEKDKATPHGHKVSMP